MADQAPSSSQQNDPLAESIVDILDAAQNLMQLSEEHRENDDAGVSGSKKKKKKRISGEDVDEVDQRLIDFKVIARPVKRVKKYRSLAELYEVTIPIDDADEEGTT